MTEKQSFGNFRPGRLLALSLVLLLSALPSAWAQKHGAQVSGVVFETRGEKAVPLSSAAVVVASVGVETTTDRQGRFTLRNLPSGKVVVHVSHVGKVSVDTLIKVRPDVPLHITMEEATFRLKDVSVTARANRAGQATASTINRTAMEHLQATSLKDVLALIPGELSTNPSLSSAATIALRDISGHDLAALGTAIIQDGAPMSNNANLSSLSPTISGSTSAMGGGANPNSGVDIRSISMGGVESVEVIRGIPSVQYGDITSGAVIVNSRAGRTPLEVNMKLNKNVWETSANQGFAVGRTGAINFLLDYAYNVDDPVQSYLSYRRENTGVMYSDVFLGGRLKSNSSLKMYFGQDRRKRNPDDESTRRASSGRDLNLTLNTNGVFSFKNKDMWLRNVHYVLSGSYTAKRSWNEELYTAANAPYSGTTVDGAVLANGTGRQVFDKDGNEITRIAKGEKNQATYLPSSYFGRNTLDGKEINLFAKLSATFFKRIGRVDNRFLFGGDFKTDGNEGDGLMFNPSTPPYRNLSSTNSTQRPRRFKDVPWVNQGGVWAEENLTWNFGERALRVQGGIRYDRFSVAGGVFSPRVNAAIDVLPRVLTLRGGYGITAKAPTLMMLYPQDAYFEYINLNEIGSYRVPEADQLFITTTKVRKTQNKNLHVAKNHKAEVGFDLKLGKATLSVTAFQEHMDNAYGMARTFNSFMPFRYIEYKRGDDGIVPKSAGNDIVSYWYTPGNYDVVHNKGIEWDLQIGRIDAIRTSFSFSGAYYRNDTWTNAPVFEDNSGTGATGRKDIGIYQSAMYKSHSDRLTSALRVTHNIPQIGLVVTATMQTIWKMSDWYSVGNDSIPLGYLSQSDASVNWFEAGKYGTRQDVIDDGKSYMLRNVSEAYKIKESYRPLFCFNLNVTKEIGKWLRASFFANNFFRNYPLANSKRSPGSRKVRGSNFFFGCELSLRL